MHVLGTLIFIFCTTSLLVLLYRSYVHRDILGIGAIFPRLYLSVVTLLYLLIPGTPAYYIHIGAVSVFIGDIIISLVKEFTKNYERKLYEKTQREHEALKSKFFAVIDTSDLPVYTISLEGEVEYCNSALCEFLNTPSEELKGSDFFSFFSKNESKVCSADVVKELLSAGFLILNLKTPEKESKVKIVGRETKNGHTTITGSLYFI